MGAGRQKFNQLDGDGHYLYLQTQFSEDRCMQFRVIVVTEPHTHTHPPTNRQDRLQYTAPQLARSVTNRYTVAVWYCHFRDVRPVISE